MSLISQKKLIFLSHSSKDREFAGELVKQLESVFSDGIQVFASTRPTAIPSGSDWFDKLVLNLRQADALLILLTPSAENSVWIGFELGYFWRIHSGSRIHILYHPDSTIPSPLDRIQGKLITDSDQIQNFFVQIGADLEISSKQQPDADILATIAQKISIPPAERTMQRFEELLDSAEWISERIEDQEVWICQGDVQYQIVEGSEPAYYFGPNEFGEKWAQGFPDKSCTQWEVRLKVGPNFIKEMIFMGLDGGRYFVPMPELKSLSDEVIVFYWDRNSIEFKVGKIISHFYPILPSFEAFAIKQGIQIIDTSI